MSWLSWLRKKPTREMWLAFGPEEGVLAPTRIFIPAKGRIRMPADQRNWDVCRPTHYALFKHNKYKPTAYAPNGYNELQSLCARAMKGTPPVNKERMDHFVQWVKQNFRYLFPGLRKRKPVEMDVYLRNSNASPAVKAAIQRAHVKLLADGVTHDAVLSKNELYKYTVRKAFIKVENNLYDSPAGKIDKPPRLIQGAQPEFIALVGPAFMSIQAEIKRIWCKDHFVWFTSGANARDTAMYIDEQKNWKIFENDVSSYDASICEELCRLELFLAAKFGARRAVLDLMEANINTHGYTSKGIKYQLKGTRKSGDPYTSVFNSILNGLMHSYCVCQSGQLEVQQLQSNLRMLVQGDDNLLVHPHRVQPRWDLLLQLGFKSDNITRKHIMEAEFCSSSIYLIEDGLSFGPKVGRMLNKLCCFNNPPLNQNPYGVVRGVALGLQSFASFVPLLQVVVNRLLQLTKGYVAVRPPQFEWQMVSGYHKLQQENNFWMIERYYFDSGYVSRFKQIWSGIQFGHQMDGGIMDMLWDKDTAAPHDIYNNNI